LKTGATPPSDPMKTTPLLFLLFFLPYAFYAQSPKKSVNAIPALTAIKIDGFLDEPVWKTAPAAVDFIQRIPFNGRPATFPTEVRFVYDNTGLYIGAMMFDPNPDSIPTQLGLRDSRDLNADYFLVMLSPFNDGINAFCFKVWVSDVQSDFKLPGTGNEEDEDYSWDAVWQSKVRMNDQGWVVEMKIPYSAIRFPKKPDQEWGINCQRGIRRYREDVTWNLVDSKIQGYVNQGGILEGIEGIKPPIRLSIMPYVSGYVEKNPDDPQWQFTYNYGADLKYGINESFTLDMTLIPDFGQVPSDDKIYNFTPFEIRYDEKRQFFTEGTELFNKGGIFYSRRVGDQPKGYDKVRTEMDSTDRIIENPMQTRLINATKVSGRTNKGLGIGFFNAISANTWATVEDTITGETRKILTQGFTNYNMVVLDQNLKNNSFFDILNTNYFMPTEGYTANVTGTDFKFANKKYTYALTGNAFLSQKYYSHDKPEFGYRYNLAYGKISGNFQFTYSQLLETDKYDPNDMGFNLVNNRFNNDLTLRYNIYEPFGKFLNWFNALYIAYNCLFKDFRYTLFQIEAASNTTTTKYLSLGANFNSHPIPSHDYYEPRVDGWMFIAPAYATLTLWLSPDYRKKLAIDASITGYLAPQYHSSAFGITVEPRYRISDRLFLIYHFLYEKVLNDVGYVLDSTGVEGNTVILFGRRDRQTITNILEANFMFNSKMSVNLRGRHYWVSAPYFSFYQLQSDGTLNPVDYAGNADINFNQFNIDLSYVWNFAPGSQLSVVWKNAITTYGNLITPNFFKDLGNTLSSPASNSFSIRILYYLDALYFKKKTKNEG